DPARAGQMDDQMKARGLDVEELSVSRHVVDDQAGECVEGRVKRLERTERCQMRSDDRPPLESRSQVGNQGGNFRKFWHHPSVPQPAATFRWPLTSASSRR